MPQVYVVRSSDKWMIKTEGRVQGHFSDYAQAVAAAIDIAENIGNTGREAEVLVSAECRAYRKLWVYGRDLYPNSLGRPKSNRVRGTYVSPPFAGADHNGRLATRCFQTFVFFC
jgi:hypothetical protein